ncbi:translation initiation factor IF-2-like [Neovison vison]|uniref:translation initiation factor IF-2-like n=1 Tax=Neovison vison TaxID=452646 RepID=UPI001CEFD3E9|nr:translation initiation factor IF-2-like [Neogale vison]
MGGGGGGDERAAAPAPPVPLRPPHSPALIRRACPRRRSARVRATAAAEPSSPRRGHGGRRRAGRLPPPSPQRFPVGARVPSGGGGGSLRKRFRFKRGSRVSVRGGTAGGRGHGSPPGAAKAGTTREDARASAAEEGGPVPARPRAECGVGAGGRASRRQAWEPQTARLEAQRLDALPLALPRPPPLPGLWDESAVRFCLAETSLTRSMLAKIKEMQRFQETESLVPSRRSVADAGDRSLTACPKNSNKNWLLDNRRGDFICQAHISQVFKK